MKQIKEIVEHIEDELEGAEGYAKAAALYRDRDKALCDMYRRLAMAEMEHVTELHKQAVRLIEDQRKAGAEVPPAMQAVWDWEHGKQIDASARVRALLASYKGE